MVIVIVAAACVAVAIATVAVWLADTLYGSGRMHAVIAVIAVVLLGLAGWMAVIDRRLSRLERQRREQQRTA